MDIVRRDMTRTGVYMLGVKGKCMFTYCNCFFNFRRLVARFVEVLVGLLDTESTASVLLVLLSFCIMLRVQPYRCHGPGVVPCQE